MEKIKKIVVDENLTMRLLTLYDPLCLKLADGRPIAFNTAYECYLFLMTKTKALFPHGYIETPLLLYKLYLLTSWNDSMDLYEELSGNGVPKVMYLKEYEPVSSETYFHTLCRGLCSVFETSFDATAFRHAFDIVVKGLKNKNKENKDECV